MKIRLDSARYEPLLWEETIEPTAEEQARSGVERISPISVRGTLTFSEPSYLLEAALLYSVEVACDRCLAPTELGLASEFQLLVARSAKGREREGERQLAADDLGLLEVGGEGIETGPLVMEQVVLDLPQRPLCRPDCRGLCPSCGADRNRAACSCIEEPVDSRWGALAALKTKIVGRPEG